MYVLGARFSTLAAASAALLAIRASVTVAPGDVAVRLLGSTQYEHPVNDFLLAGRFADPHVDVVVAIVREHGGRVIERRQEPVHSGTYRVLQFGAAAREESTVTRASRPGEHHRSRVALGPGKRQRRPAARLRVRAARQGRLR
ncbi:MAG TPA: hypothetical protein VNL94_03410 [Candidatus Binatia bacterium]|nr:hypothetical protein [Candidatus Binatia bacterium]